MFKNFFFDFWDQNSFTTNYNLHQKLYYGILPEFLWCLIMRSQKLKFVRFEEVSNLLNIIFKHTVHCILSKTRYCQKKFWGKWRTQFSVKSVIKSFPYVENLSRHTVYVLFSICLKKKYSKYLIKKIDIMNILCY